MQTQVLALARQAGFDLAGIAPCAPAPHADKLQSWLDAGYAGEMGYLGRNAERRADPRAVLPEGRAILVLGKHYRSAEPLPALWRDPARGRIARYAWGADYHDLLLPALRQLVGQLEALVGRPVLAKPYVDTGPVLERPMGAAAGLGFIGKNTMLIHPRQGSWFFVSELLLDLALEPTLEPARGGCGSCTRCQVACPTNAFPQPYVLNASRCISYLTIELKGPIPRELRPLLGNWIYGCDVCNAVCPWNLRFGEAGDGALFQPHPERIAPALVELLGLDAAGFSERFRRSPIKRTKRRGLLRNVAVALGNWGSDAALPALGSALNDVEPLIRGHVAWAIGRIGGATARRLLERRRILEEDAWVREEIELALGV